jgi:hypothetical protein
VPLGLHEATHNAKAQPQSVVAQGHGGDYRVVGALAAS